MWLTRMRSPEKISALLFSVVITLLYSSIFLSIDLHTVPVSGWYNVGMLLLQVVGIVGLSWGVFAVISSNKYLFAIAFPLLCLISAASGYYYLTVGVGLTPVSFELAMVNDMTMWWTLVSVSLIFVLVITLILSVLAVICRFKFVESSRKHETVLACVGLLIVLSQNFLPKRVCDNVSVCLPYSIYYSFRGYLENRRNYLEFRDTYANEFPQTDSIRPTVVFVLGESLRADHLPQNGYHRNTTPRLTRERNIISFPNIHTEATYTHVGVPIIMTRTDSLNPDYPFTSQSFVTLFKNAGYETAWFANQDLGSSYTYFAHECDELVYCNAGKPLYYYGSWLDSDIMPEFAEWMGKSDAPKLAILHTIGSHWWYKSHYTSGQSLFLPDPRHKDIADLSDTELINGYDNTIVATDDFLYQVISSLRADNAVVFYLSDHGEALGEGGKYLHGIEAPAVHNPACLIWYSDSYGRTYPARIASLRKNALMSADVTAAFHTILDLANFKTRSLDVGKSLSR